MSVTRQLAARFVEDRDSLSTEDFERMLEGLRAAPKLVLELRDQLMTDDLLWQKLGLERGDFLAQVDQRVSDFDARQEDVFNQVAELRAVAQSELERPRPRRRQPSWIWWSLGLSCVALIGLSYSAGWFGGGMERVPVAEVDRIDGSVRKVADGKDSELSPGQHLFTGDTLITAEGSAIAWRYKDGTTVDLAASTTAQLAYDLRTRGKLVQLKTGEVLAEVTKQAPDRPMLFTTPHAQARVVGTRLRLKVEGKETRLEVEEGKVELTRLRDTKALLVAADQAGVASPAELAYSRLPWPLQRKEAVFVFEGADQDCLARNPQTKNFRETPLEPQGDATITNAQALRTAGGWFGSAEAGDDLLPLLKETNEFTLEALVAPDDSEAAGTSRVVAFADDGREANFRLVQKGRSFEFQMTTASGEKSVRLVEAQAGKLVYLTATYRDGLLASGRDGTPAFDNREATGNLQHWKKGPLTIGGSSDGANAWKGTLYALAIHRRVLPLDEQGQNARHGLINFGTRHLPPGWRDLLADFDPSRALSGNWQLEADGWQNDPGEAAARIGQVDSHAYDLRLELRPASLDQPLEIILPLGATRGVVRLPVQGKEQLTAGVLLEGGALGGETRGDMADVQLAPNRKQTLRLLVKSAQEQTTVHVELDGQVWFTWQGPIGELAVAPSPPGSAGAIDLRVPSGSVQLLSARLHEMR